MRTITDFIGAIENGRFIEAHEILEESWKELKQAGRLDEARIQKGLINGATAIGLMTQKHRPEAARKLWERYRDKYPPLIRSYEGEHATLYRTAAALLTERSMIIYEDINGVL